MVHLYHGDGKGKTTCAMGLALRAAGRGKRVVIAQFLKCGESGERMALRGFSNVTLIPVPETMKFVFAMSVEEKAAAEEKMLMILQAAKGLMSGCDLLVLDEVCGAVSTGLLTQEQVTALLDSRPEGVEVVMTGRDPAQTLLDRADYVTEMRKVKHPYDQDVPAREGIEY